MQITEITKDNFEAEVLKSDKPVILDFWASWCGPCRMMAPVMEEIAAENPDIKVGKVNVDAEQELAVEFSVMSIPTFIAFKDGKKIGTTVGVQDKASVLKLVKG